MGSMIDTSKVTRVEVIDHTKDVEHGGGRCYTYWSGYNDEDDLNDPDIPNPTVTLSLQDDSRTLKIFISPPTNEPQ